MDSSTTRNVPKLSHNSASKSRPGDSPIPALASGNFQPAAATTTEEKFSDAGQVHSLTGVCPTVALHVLWDFPRGVGSIEEISSFASRYRSAARVHQPEPVSGSDLQIRLVRKSRQGCARAARLQHTRDSIDIAQRLHSRDISLWFADGSNYPGTANIRQRKQWFEEELKARTRDLSPGPATAGGVQALRAGLLSHRYRGLGNGPAPGACRRAAGQSAGRHRPPLSVAEHRADCRLAAVRRHARADSISTTAAMPTTI